MITSKEVFATRKQGKLDEAYKMACELLNQQEIDEWDIKAFAWCTIDLIKRDAQSGNTNNLAYHANQLQQLNISPSDDILTKQREYALKLCNPNSQEILNAKALSQQGNHFGALNIYRSLVQGGEGSIDVRTSFAWELYRVSKALLEQSPANYMGAKRNINDYLKLKLETPSLLHTCMLQLAYRIAKEGKLNMGAFVKFWELDNLRPEDYEQGLSDKGDTYPSTAEKVIQLATKHAFQNNSTPELLYLLPFIDRCIMRFPDNIWLKLNKAKALLATNQNQEAMSYGIQVVKNKPHDYWAWELLGDIHQASNTEKTFSCYCKALLCSKDIGFVSKVKIKLAELLEKNELFPEAKLEIEQVIQYKTEKEHKIPQEAERLTKTHWFAETQSSQSNQELYTSHAPLAESILYENLPWYQAVIGNTFSTEDKQGKTKYKRKLYVKSKDIPFEVIIPKSKLTFSKNNLGTGIKIKGEFDSLRRFQVYAIDERKADSDWDIFTEQLCIVDHVNAKKKIIHFIFDKYIDGIIAFDDLSDRFSEGDAILLRLAKYFSKQGTRYKALTASKTNQLPPEHLLTTFSDEVRVSNGMGFTEDDIFIPPPLIEAHKVNDGSTVTGKAILNYNSKKSTWGWKAISLTD